MPNSVKIYISLVILLVSLLLNVSPVKAAIDSCTVTVNPSNISPNSNSDLTFSITNGLATTAVWAKITRPSDGFTITGGNSSGFSESHSVSSIEFAGTDGFIGADVTTDFLVNISTATGSQGSWVVELSDLVDGTSPTTCTGETRVAISDSPADITSPGFVGDLTITNLSDTTATFTFATDENTTSIIQYGLTTAYGTSVSNTLNTSHSINISGLNTNSTYHYKVTITDAAGNATVLSDNTFVTAKQGTTVTVTTTNTSYVDKTVYIDDTVLPVISLLTDFGKIYKDSPLFKGVVTDNIGVAKVNYSIDGGKSWIPVDYVESVGGKTSTYKFTLGTLDDGNYKIQVAVIDTSGNTSKTKVYTLVIDRLPPQVGASLISIGNMPLTPDANGIIYTIPGLNQDITLSAVGGPISIDLSAGKEVYPLTKNPGSSLWKGTLNFSEGGMYKLIANSVDGAGKVTTRTIGSIMVLEPGKIKSLDQILPNSTLTVYVFDAEFKRFSLWNPSGVSQQNPQIANKDGSYKYVLPSGKYYIKVSKEGYRDLNTELFTLDSTTVINADFFISPNPVYKIGPLSFYLPSFFSDSTQLTLNHDSKEILRNESFLLSNNFPGFNLNTTDKKIDNISLRGKPTVVTFLNSWSPQTFSQLNALEELGKNKNINVLAVFPQESESVVKLLKARGNYCLDMAADPDGILLLMTKMENLPTHFFLDRRGIVRSIKSGILNSINLADTLIK